jgi:hypothetical protein
MQRVTRGTKADLKNGASDEEILLSRVTLSGRTDQHCCKGWAVSAAHKVLTGCNEAVEMLASPNESTQSIVEPLRSFHIALQWT